MIGIFYGSTTGTTETVARDIAAKLGVGAEDVHDVARAGAADAMRYDVLLLGSSTWGSGELQDDWYGFLDALKRLDLSGKKVALFGCGDGASYPDTFCDAIGLIYDGLAGTGCTFIGAYWPEGYDVTDSLVARNGQFVGLAIDETDGADKTAAREEAWVAQLKGEM